MRVNRIKKFQENLKALRLRLFPAVSSDKLFAPDVIVHFSYHKCLTAYYNRIMNVLSDEFAFRHTHFNSNIRAFEESVLRSERKCVLSVNNHSDIPFDKFPQYRGSHFVRDPRDLIVSGYRYHLWTEEQWCNDPGFDWRIIASHPYFLKYVAHADEDIPKNISYKDYLNTLDMERGMIVELIWRQPHFTQMEAWNFNNRNIIELKYEDIIGNEIDCYGKIFRHYQFHPKIIDRGLEIVERLSLKNLPKSDTGHVRNGSFNQWMSEFTPLHKKY